YSEELGSTSQQIEHSNCSIHVIAYSPDTTIVFKSDTELERCLSQHSMISEETTDI
ncbi:3655_t:CDS:1, partial [Dentiscutata heterogama]